MTDKRHLPRSLKIILRMILVILIIMGIIVLSSFIYHKVRSSEEYDFLKDNGYINSVPAGEYNLNVCIRGADRPQHTLVGLSGMDADDMSVCIESFAKYFTDKNRVVVADRAGYGYSDDTNKPQTYERVVNDYRTALKNSGCAPPYVLMGHSYGGDYASYWQQFYPDEVEGVIYFDPAYYLGDPSVMDKEQGFWSYGNDYDAFSVVLKDLGVVRVIYDLNNELSFCEKYSNDVKNSASRDLYMNSITTMAKSSEMELAKKNNHDFASKLKKTDIPKLYIDASAYSKEEMIEELRYTYKFMKDSLDAQGIDPDDEKQMDTLWEKISVSNQEAYDAVIKPYVDKLGSCEYIRIPGNHYIFEHKPEETAKACQSFLDRLDK